MENEKNPVPVWLQNLQDNSWEIELLISGGAVFTLLQFPDAFLIFYRSVKTSYALPGLNVYLILGMACIKILTNGFILHLLLRSFWLAMVCINYTFPQGIEGRRMKQAHPFRSRHVDGDLREQIMWVDRISGLVIFMTILSTLVLLGFLLVMVLIVFSANNVRNTLFLDFVENVLGYALALYFADLLLMGIFRRIPGLSWLLFPFFWIFDILSLRRLFERPLALFSSNVKRPAFVGGALVFGVITGLTTYMPIARTLHWPRFFDAREFKDQLTANQDIVYRSRFYADQTDRNHVGLVTLPSHLIETNLLHVNFRYDKWMDDLLKASQLPKKDFYLSNLINLSIDDSLYTHVIWYTVPPSDEDEPGLVGMIDLTHLSNGPHKLTFESKNLPVPAYQEVRSDKISKVEIPFWKDVH